MFNPKKDRLLTLEKLKKKIDIFKDVTLFEALTEVAEIALMEEEKASEKKPIPVPCFPPLELPSSFHGKDYVKLIYKMKGIVIGNNDSGYMPDEGKKMKKSEAEIVKEDKATRLLREKGLRKPISPSTPPLKRLRAYFREDEEEEDWNSKTTRKMETKLEIPFNGFRYDTLAEGKKMKKPETENVKEEKATRLKEPMPSPPLNLNQRLAYYQDMENPEIGVLLKEDKATRFLKEEELKKPIPRSPPSKLKRERDQHQEEEEEEEEEDWRDIKTTKKKNKKAKLAMGNNDNPSCMTQLQSQHPELPQEFKNKIAEMNGSEVLFIIEKQLFASDVEPNLGRLFMPKLQIVSEFLTEEEKKQALKEKNVTKEKVRVKIIEPSLEVNDIVFKIWHLPKKHGKVSVQYVFIETWNAIRKKNNIKKGDIVQVWSFRVEGKISFAMVLRKSM